jgi:hypothetical protein
MSGSIPVDPCHKAEPPSPQGVLMVGYLIGSVLALPLGLLMGASPRICELGRLVMEEQQRHANDEMKITAVD